MNAFFVMPTSPWKRQLLLATQQKKQNAMPKSSKNTKNQLMFTKSTVVGISYQEVLIRDPSTQIMWSTNANSVVAPTNAENALHMAKDAISASGETTLKCAALRKKSKVLPRTTPPLLAPLTTTMSFTSIWSLVIVPPSMNLPPILLPNQHLPLVTHIYSQSVTRNWTGPSRLKWMVLTCLSRLILVLNVTLFRSISFKNCHPNLSSNPPR